ncbi:iron ABC transporter permease [Xenorhabdus sp. DI]|uniref:FecCD family ABC transporter permease n=1 Tax=Xenorhabdus doucetiae TaxID=351671 RepID=UPI0019CD92A1|nr:MULTISPECIES: iron ABC transporter permease [unclassified Xenorhabdus]MBD2785254.1 iron ABC transporter permease [Xenorhabdus sp. 3]MBD2789297.1 iron ABC transporter permease [Xenorhabdus sp. DI]MBD2795042.1 iron ABC transporter permease [Xenorhabdus sp. 18]
MRESVTLRLGRYSRRVDVSALWRLGLAVLTFLLVMLVSLSLGKIPLTPAGVFRALFSGDQGGIPFIVGQLRFPRILLAALVGAGLGMAGLILQFLVRNPLASPDLLGITSGAGAAAVIYLSFFSMTFGSAGLPVAAMVGAAVVVAAVYLLSWHRGVSPLSLVLTGVGVSALLTAVSTFVLVFSPLTTTLSAYVWLTGSVYGATWQDVRSLGIWWLGYLPALFLLSRHVVVQQLDDGLATGIGARVQLQRAMLLLLSVALAGVAIAHGGAMAFVGLIAPHIARQLVGAGFVGQAVMTALCGAMLVMLADIVGRVIFLPADLPAGIFVAALGTPFFLWLLIKQCH